MWNASLNITPLCIYNVKDCEVPWIKLELSTLEMEQGCGIQTNPPDPQNGEKKDNGCATESQKGAQIPNGQCTLKSDCKTHGMSDDSDKLTNSLLNGKKEGMDDCCESPHVDASSLPRPEISNPSGIETFDGNVQYQFGEPPPCECDECILEHGDEVKAPVKKFSRVRFDQIPFIWSHLCFLWISYLK